MGGLIHDYLNGIEYLVLRFEIYMILLRDKICKLYLVEPMSVSSYDSDIETRVRPLVFYFV
jgi:hypothetical protein